MKSPWIWLRSLLRGRRLERELDEEMRYHLDRLVEENLARGMSAEQAAAAARMSFGGVEQAKEACRDAHGTRWLSDLHKDVRYGLRSLRRTPGITALVALSVGIGVGANSAVFGLLDAVLVRPLPVPEPDRLVRYSSGEFTGTSVQEKTEPGPMKAFSYPLYQRLGIQAGLFEAVAAQESGETMSVVQWSGSGDRTDGDLTVSDIAVGRHVSGNFFPVLRVTAQRGRTLVPQDERPGADPVVVLSHAFWQRRFGADPSVIGARITINGRSCTVVGVTSPSFTGTRLLDRTDFWAPLTLHAALNRGSSMLEKRQVHWLLLLGRLRPGATMAAAQAQVNATLQQYLVETEGGAGDGDRRRAVRIDLEAAADGVRRVNPQARVLLGAVLAGATLLLLIVCLNVSHLLLARALTREREMSIRASLGATTGRLVRQQLTEGVLLATLALGVALAMTRLITAGLLLLIADDGPALDLRLDARGLSYLGLLTLAAALFMGVVPSWGASRRQANLQLHLRSTATAIAGGAPRLVSRLLLTSQVAFSLVLLVAAGLLAGSLYKLRHIDKGFSEHVLLVNINPRAVGLTPTERSRLGEQVVARLNALPEVAAAALSTSAVLSGGRWRDNVALPGRTALRDVEMEAITPRYFEALGIALLRGRAFTEQDRDNARPVVIVNETLARRLFGTVDVVGKRFRYEHFPAASRPDVEVVGVARDARTLKLRDPAAAIGYVPLPQAQGPLGTLAVRARDPDVDPARLAGPVRRAVREVHPGLPIIKMTTIRNEMVRSYVPERFVAVLASSFGVMSLFLICLGLFGAISQWATGRTQEIGVRLALGASVAGVRWLVMRQAFKLVLAGVLLGLPVAAAAAHLLKVFLFAMPTVHPGTLGAATATLFLVTAAAAYLPARRASRLDPTAALRLE